MSDWELYRNPERPVQLFLMLYQCSNGLVKRLEEQLSPYDLTLGRLCLLVSLKRFGKPALPSELSDDLAVTRANISGLLNGLEKASLIKRELDPTNRRRIWVQLTDKGQQLLESIWPVYVHTISEGIKDKLTSEEQNQLILLLNKLQ